MLGKSLRRLLAPAAAWRRAALASLAALLLWSAPAAELSAAAGRAAPPAPPAGSLTAAADGSAGGADEEPHSWLLKWTDPGQAKPLPGTVVLRRQQLPAAIEVVRPADAGADPQEWLRRLRHTPGVEYIEPNGRVSLLAAAAADDPGLPKQHYLDQIGAKSAWSTVREQTDLTIALVDTGVDLDHPDLQDNLVKGTNLVDPGQPPDDDNGHGTAVAGVLAGKGNNAEGIAGILWKAKMMPIKALDADGYGDEERLGEAILYAVKNGAKIVVLSVGLYRYSPYMNDITAYAESKGVLLVAASGNDGGELGAKAKVKYPAAYPTVLAVAGVTPDGNPEPRSNSGSEIDIAAPWNVYTTAVGGGYTYQEGTSMSAPQAAAAAALVWAAHPDYKPYQVREMLRQSAKDIGKSGVDEQSGYGLLQIGKAVTAALKPDAYEPNDSRDQAKLFPLGKKITAELSGGSDADWYRIDAPYDGTVSIRFQGIVASGQTQPSVHMTHYAGDKAQSSKDTQLGNEAVDWQVKKGSNYFKLQYVDRNVTAKLPYLLASTFAMAPDAYEKNDKQYQAFTLPPRSQTTIGNFNETGDRDWYAVHFDTGGTLDLLVTTDTARIDPSLSFGRSDGAMQVVDDNSEGHSESLNQMNITPGTYYIRVYNAMSEDASPTVGEYKLSLDFKTKYTDPNEPNNKSYEATVVSPGSDYSGVFADEGDVDWYQLRLTDRSAVRIHVDGIPDGIGMKAEVMSKTQQPVFSMTSSSGAAEMTKEQQLDAGLYYIKVTASSPFDKQYYGLRIDADRMVAGFRDIAGHWAEDAIVALKQQEIVGGAGGYRFRPDESITRAEAVSMLVRAFRPPSAARLGFPDVPASHWAAGAIAQAVQAGWAGGYPDGRFEPNRPISREEMGAMLGRVLEVGGAVPSAAPYSDVGVGRWSAAALNALKQRKLVSGYPDASFRPEQTASRAEFAALLVRALGAK